MISNFTFIPILCILTIICDTDGQPTIGNIFDVEVFSNASSNGVKKSEIMNGAVGTNDMFPYMVSIQTSSFGQHICGGTLLTPYHILTAAHCLFAKTFEKQFRPDELQIRIGPSDLRQPADIIARVKWLKIHEEYKKRPIVNDIAVIKVDRSLTSSKSDIPRLSTSFITPATVTGPCLTAGWGRLGPDPHPAAYTSLDSSNSIVPNISSILNNQTLDQTRATFNTVSHNVIHDVLGNSHSSESLSESISSSTNLLSISDNKKLDHTNYSSNAFPQNQSLKFVNTSKFSKSVDESSNFLLNTQILNQNNASSDNTFHNETPRYSIGKSNFSLVLNSTKQLDQGPSSNSSNTTIIYNESSRVYESRNSSSPNIPQDFNISASNSPIPLELPPNLDLSDINLLYNGSSQVYGPAINSSYGTFNISQGSNASSAVNPPNLSPNPPTSNLSSLSNDSGHVYEAGTGFRREINLRFTLLPLQDVSECGKDYEVKISKDAICAGKRKSGTDTCKGDSGGPLICDGKLEGIVSFGDGCNNPEHLGVYTRVYIHLKWIQKQINMGSNSIFNYKHFFMLLSILCILFNY